MTQDDTNIPTTNCCQDCNQQPAIYQCPRCRFRSCSLRCCQSHKRRLQCNGKRDRTAFLALREMSDATLTSDYLFLEDVLRHTPKRPRSEHSNSRSISAAKRGAVAASSSSSQQQQHALLQQQQSSSPCTTTTPTLLRTPVKLPKTLCKRLRHVVQTAHTRGVTVLLQPDSFVRHQTNGSYVKTADRTLHWKVEICITTDTQQQQNNNKQSTVCAETSTLQEALDQLYLSTAPQDGLFLRRIPHRTYNRVSPQSTWKDVLQDMTVIEYPTLYIGPVDQFPVALSSTPVA